MKALAKSTSRDFVIIYVERDIDSHRSSMDAEGGTPTSET